MRKTVRALFWTAVVIGAIVGVLRATILEWWTIPEDDPQLAVSLAPSLWAGDVVLLYRGSKPKFGDLVRCTDPQDPARFVVGRIMGEANDNLEMHGGDIVVNGRRSTQEMLCTEPKIQIPNPSTGVPEDVLCSIEEAGGVKHKRVTRPTMLVERKATVSDGNVFLVSDDRVYSYDSRDYGAIPRTSCTQLIFFRLWGKAGAGDEDSRFTYIQ